MTSILAQLSVRRGTSALDFYAAAFGAVVDYRVGDEEIVAQLSVGDATFWVSDESPEHGNFSPETVGGCTTRMLLIVDDPDAVVDARSRRARRWSTRACDEHGWRLGRVLDPFGHHWEIGKPLIAWPPAGDSLISAIGTPRPSSTTARRVGGRVAAGTGSRRARRSRTARGRSSGGP